MGDQARYSSHRRATEPSRTHRHHDGHHHHQHAQPRYPDPETPQYPSRRRHTEPRSSNSGAGLTRVHSRPEDYRNKPRPDKLFSYICFDDQGHPQDCDEVKASRKNQSQIGTQAPSASKPKCPGQHVETKGSLHRVDSYSSHEWARTDDSGNDADSEDELTLPSMYHHDIAQKDDEWHSGHRSQTKLRSPVRRQRTDLSRTEDHEQCRRTSPSSYSPHGRSPSPSYSPSSSSCRRSSVSPSQRHERDHTHESVVPSSSPNAQQLIAKVADHLQAHKGAYGHTSTKQLVSELLGEVVRKVADGGLDSKMMKDVVREVQHVL